MYRVTNPSIKRDYSELSNAPEPAKSWAYPKTDF